ncbi:hypothetical protein G6F37_011160 [Rhizopus arrhizus]|nr:hypothetical protein G6F38_010005 [Rhizopus arrhizus]KAG1150624.1 hypothetical protein G6F37_011160 [Rhizopus arrhizus]
MDRNVTDHKIDTIIDSFELYVEDNSNDDLQPVVTARKRKSRENTPQSESQKRLKDKRKTTDSEVTTTSSTGISTTDELTMFNRITLDDYDLEYNSDDFDAPVVKRPCLSESTKSAFRITKSTSAAVESSTTASKTSLTSHKPRKPVSTAFKSAATFVKSNFCPMPVDKASDIKEGPKKISKHVMTIKTIDFFVEVFLSLVLSKGGNSTILKDMTKNYRRLISKYKEAYFEDAGYTPSNLPYTQQIALHECTKIQTAYYNNIKAHFGNRLRGLISKLFKKKEKAESFRGEMQANKSSIKAIKEATRKKIYRPYNQNPKTGSKFETLGAVVDLNKKAFKHQGFQKSLRFQGTLETDGVSVSIIKQNTDTSKKSPKPNAEKKVDGNQTEHIEGLCQADLKSTEGKCILIDSGRRDLMYCMKETSTAEEKQTLIFTKNNCSKYSRHFRYLRKRTQHFVDQKAEAILSRSESNSVNLKKFVQYIKARASVKTTLYEYYGNETTKSKETYFPESEFDFRVDQKCNLYYDNLFITRIYGFSSQLENYSIDSSVKS